MDKSAERYKKLADARAEKDDLLGALALLYSVKDERNSHQILVRIADVYADMGLLDLSNRFWYKYMFYAPKEKVSTAYEDLAINYFYMDNLLASGYYFHKKLSVDGYISQEGIDKEVLDFFSGEEYKRHAYRIVYPYDKADFTLDVKNGKRAIALGAFEEAVKILSSIPEQCRDEEVSGDLTVAFFMCDDLDGAEKECRSSLKRHGETVTAYCNLSTVYDMRKDYENSEYYYHKALDCKKGAKGEAYKIATCSIERQDHETAKRCLETILSERPYEISMRFFYGVALLNLGEYEKAVQAFKMAYRTDPNDFVIKYYLDFAIKIFRGGEDKEKLLPLSYEKEIPHKIATKYYKEIKELAKSTDKSVLAMRKQEKRDLCIWAMKTGSDSVMRSALMVFSYADNKRFYGISQEILLDPDVKEPLKRLLTYVLIVKGHKKRTGAVQGGIMMEFTPRKLLCEKSPDGGLYLSAYALSVSKMISYDVDDLDRLSEACDEVYRAIGKTVTEAEVNNEEIAGLIVYLSGFEKYSKIKEVVKIFEVSEEKLEKLAKIYLEARKEIEDD